MRRSRYDNVSNEKNSILYLSRKEREKHVNWMSSVLYIILIRSRHLISCLILIVVLYVFSLSTY